MNTNIEDCPICNEKWDDTFEKHRDPLLLQCGHTLCRACLNDTKRCPICRNYTANKAMSNYSLIDILKNHQYPKCLCGREMSSSNPAYALACGHPICSYCTLNINPLLCTVCTERDKKYYGNNYKRISRPYEITPNYTNSKI